MAQFSNTYNFTDTAASIINSSVSKIGKLGEGDTLSAAEYNLCLASLNRILKSMMVDNKIGGSYKVWQRQRGNLFLRANSGKYTLSANSPWWCNAFSTITNAGSQAVGTNSITVSNSALITNGTTLGLQLDSGNLQWTTATSVTGNTVTLANNLTSAMSSTADLIYVITDGPSQPPQMIEHIVLRDSNGNDTPVKVMDYDEWFYLPSKQSPGFSGDPIGVYLEQHLNGPTPFAYLYTDVAQAQDTSKYFFIGYIRELQDLVNETDLLDAPKEWLRFLVYELAYDVVDDFLAVWTPTNEAKRQEAIRTAVRANRPKSSKGFRPGDRGWNDYNDGFWSR